MTDATVISDFKSKPEERIRDLANYIVWRAKLIWMLNEGIVSEDVFKKIYDDYTSKINSIAGRENYLIDLLKGAPILSRLKEIKARLDELKVRHRIGEISDGEYTLRYTALRADLNTLERDAMRIEFRYRQLRRVLANLFGGNLFKIKEQIKRCYNNLPSIIKRGNIINSDMITAMKRDLEIMMNILEHVDMKESSQTSSSDFKEGLFEVIGETFDEDIILKKVTEVVKGHDDEIRRIIRAIKMGDNVLILGRHAEGKTELLLQLHKCLGGIYFHCHEEVSERELIAGFNPSAFVGKNPVHMGCLMQIVSGEIKGLPIAFIDEIMKLRPKTQIILFEAMNNKSFFNPVDGKTYYLPPEFLVVSSSNIESIVQEMPDIAFLDRFGKIIMWQNTPDDAIREILKPYNIPTKVMDFLLWVRHQIEDMRYLVPVSVRNLKKFAQEYSYYRNVYRRPEELKKLAIDRLIKVKILNPFGLREFEEAKRRIEQYIEEVL